jgi:copper oxidase (laccase) domain-containing protein
VKELLRIGPVRVVLFEASLDGTPWNARDQADIQRALRAMDWDGPVRDTVQVHADRILLPAEAGDADGFFLQAGQAALVRHADCLPVTIVDPVHAQAVLLHCGWRGCAMHLAAKGVALLKAHGSEPGDMHARIGPGIGPSDFEVGLEVLANFPQSVHSTTLRGTPSIDLPRFLSEELSRQGIPRSRITCDLRSTFGDLNLHSHRRAGASAGRMATFCLIEPTGVQS